MKAVAGVGLIIGAVCALFAVHFYALSTSQCDNYRALTGAETNVTIATGCLVKRGDVWMSIDAAVGNTSEITVK